MESIEQAVFTSAETNQSAGYQVVATSPGVCARDVEELAVWGPSHDALLAGAPNAASFNFHPLPSGAYCVSRTTPAGWEYSGRGGVRVYTQCLIVPPEVLARFANNPIALLRAALVNGSLRLYEKVPERLAPITLAGRAAVVDTALLSRLAINPGVDWLATLVQAALQSVTLGIAGGPPAEHVIAGILNCLPPACRTEMSFSTGLKFSPRRPFRLVALSGDAEEQDRVERLYNVSVLRLSGPPPARLAPTDSWPRFLQRVLKSGRTSFLTAELSRRRAGFRPEDLSALGLQLLEELETASRVENVADELPPERPQRAFWLPEIEADQPEHREQPFNDDERLDRNVEDVPAAPDHIQQSHAAHSRFTKCVDCTATVGTRPAGPSKTIQHMEPKILEKLERLDDLVYEAISGNTAALESLKAEWPQLRTDLDAASVAESREQYLRYALSIWGECLQPDGVRDPSRAVQSLDVLCMLFNEE